MDAIFSGTIDGDAGAVRRKSGLVTDFRKCGKFRELGSDSLCRIESVKRDLFAIGTSLADDTQSCRGAGALRPKIVVTRVNYLWGATGYRDSHVSDRLCGTFHRAVEERQAIGQKPPGELSLSLVATTAPAVS